jgi:hypothetical protein
MSRRRGSSSGSTSRVRRREVIASEPAVADRGEHLRGWARELAAGALEQKQAIDVEQLASMAVAKWGRGNRYERPPFETPPEIELMTHLERVGGTGALLMLRGFQHVAGGEVAAAAARAADRLARADVSMPDWASAIGAARPTRAWMIRDDDFGDGVVLFAEFEQPGSPNHTVAIYVDHNMGGVAKIIGLTRSMDDTMAAGSGLGAPQEVPLELMGGCMQSALAKVHPMNRRAHDHEDAGHYALACARAHALPPGVEIVVDEVTPDERFGLLAEFLESEVGSQYREDIDAQSVVALAIDFCAERDGEPLRWSPIAVESFLAGWLPDHAAEQREVLARTPEVLAVWVRYTGRRRGLADPKVGEIVEAIEVWTDAMWAEADAYAGEVARS